MSAIRLARGFTGRSFAIKFEGCYHGHADALLVKAGSGVATFGIPGSAGIPPETAMHTLALPYNDLGAVESAFANHPDQIACIILEPVVGNAGTVLPAPGFLRGLRELTWKHGALLIYDEVMTGFRLSTGGAQGLYREELGGGWLVAGMAGPHDAGQNHRRWSAGGRVRWAGGDHGAAGATGAGVPGRDAEREPAGDGRGHRHDQPPVGACRRGLPAAGTDYVGHGRWRGGDCKGAGCAAHHEPRGQHVHLVLHQRAGV